MHGGRTDSVVHQYLDLGVSTPPKPIVNPERFPFRVRNTTDKHVGLITGPMEMVTDVDVWVSSEKTNLQMSRFFERSISGLIRYLSASKDEVGEVIDDHIAKELCDMLESRQTRSVHPSTVIKTTAGALEKTHGVKFVLHAATVQGSVGRGYTPVDGFETSVPKALKIADEAGCSSILFPIFCAGTAGGDVAENFDKMLGQAIVYLRRNLQGRLQHVYFLAWTEAERQACLGVLDRRSSDIEALPP